MLKKNQTIFSVILSKPTRILYWSSAEWSTVEADVTYIKSTLKNYRIFYPSEKKIQELTVVSLI